MFYVIISFRPFEILCFLFTSMVNVDSNSSHRSSTMTSSLKNNNNNRNIPLQVKRVGSEIISETTRQSNTSLENTSLEDTNCLTAHIDNGETKEICTWS